MQIDVLKTYNQMGILTAHVAFDSNRRLFTILDGAGKLIAGNEVLNFSRLLLYACLDRNGQPFPAKGRPWMLLDVIPLADIPTTTNGHQDMMPRVILESGDTKVDIGVRLRCLLKSRMLRSSGNDTRDFKPFVQLNMRLDKRFIEGMLIERASLLSNDGVVLDKVPGTGKREWPMATFGTDFKQKRIDMGRLRGASATGSQAEFPLLAEALGLTNLWQSDSNHAETLGLNFLQFSFETEEEDKRQDYDSPLPLRPKFKRDLRAHAPDEIVIETAGDQSSNRLNDFRLSLLPPRTLELEHTQLEHTQAARAYDVDFKATGTLLPGTLRAEIKNLSLGAFIGSWNKSVALPHYDALDTVEGGRGASVVPSISTPPSQANEATSTPPSQANEATCALRLLIWDRSAEQRFIKSTDLVRRDQNDRPYRENAVAFGVKEVAIVGTCQVDLELRRLRDHDGEGIKMKGVLAPPEKGVSAKKIEGAPSHFHFQIKELTVPQGIQTMRVGALDIDVGIDAEGARVDNAVLEAQASIYDGMPSVEMTLDTPPLRVRPGGQDDVPGEEFEPLGESIAEDEQNVEGGFRRERPLVIEYPPALLQALSFANGLPIGRDFLKRRQTIHAREQSRRSRSQSLTMQLIQLQSEAAPLPGLRSSGVLNAGTPDVALDIITERSVLILDRAPFLVARVDVPPLVPAGDGREIGNWTNSGLAGAGWELVGSTLGFRLWLPPQGIGEATEKGMKKDGFHDLESDEPADFRFSPTARFILQASFFKQRFVEAPWNLRRILGYANQPFPGAQILEMRWEMLYGLTGSIRPKQVRLSYTDARLGRVPGRLPDNLAWIGSGPQENAYQKFRRRWAGQFQQHSSHLALLEPWDVAQPLDEKGDPLPLVLQDGLRFLLRSSAKLRYPISTQEVAKNAEDIKRRFEPPHTPDGLAGGVSYGFESANAYDALRTTPQSIPVSDEGLLRSPSFSSLGGWGYQKATFNRGLIKIHAHTAMGRVFSYSVEQPGRISLCWNKAKHVVVYERSVVSALAFDTQQDNLDGRAVLRKVREYIEISEQRRTYPEEGSAFPARDVTKTGFLQACAFGTTVINVDSRWGSDVGAIGWQIPLWRPQSPFFTGDEDADLDALRRLDPTAPDPTLEQLKALPGTDGDYMQVLRLLYGPLPSDPGAQLNPPNAFAQHLRDCVYGAIQNHPTTTATELQDLWSRLPLSRIAPGSDDERVYLALKELTVQVLNGRLRDVALPIAVPPPTSPPVSSSIPSPAPNAVFPIDTDPNPMLFSADRLAALTAAGMEISPEAQERLHTLMNGDSRIELNRILMEDAFGFLASSDRNPPNRPAALPVSTLRVYPMPIVNLELAAKAGTGIAESSNITQPQKLRFFALTHVKDAQGLVPNLNPDTDSWPPIVEVDFPDLPLPSAPQPEQVPFGDASNLDARMPSAPGIEAGYDLFTLPLTLQSRQINLTQGRTDGAVGSFIHNVTLLRSQAISAPNILDFPVLHAAVDAAGTLSEVAQLNLSHILSRLPQQGALPPAIQTELKTALQAAQNTINAEIDKASVFVDGRLRQPTDVCAEVCQNVLDTIDRAESRVELEINGLAVQLDRQVAALDGTASEVKKAAKSVVAGELEQLKLSLRPITTGTEDLSHVMASAREEVRRRIGRCTAQINELQRTVELVLATVRALSDQGEAAVVAALGDLLKVCRRLQRQIQAIIESLRSEFEDWDKALSRLLQGRLGQSLKPVRGVLGTLRNDCMTELDDLARKLEAFLSVAEKGIIAPGDWKTEWDDALRQLVAALDAVRKQVASGLESVRAETEVQAKKLDDVLSVAFAPLGVVNRDVNFLASQLDKLRDAIIMKIDSIPDASTQAASEIRAQIRIACDKASLNIVQVLKDVASAVMQGTTFCTNLSALLTSEVGEFLGTVVKDRVNKALQQLSDAVSEAQLPDAVDKVRRAFEQSVRDLELTAEPYSQLVRDTVRRTAGEATSLFQQGETALSLARALGDAPEAVGLTFNRDRIAYYLNDPTLLNHTPVVALANRIGDDLKALGVRLPTRQLADRFLPAGLDKLDVARLLPDFAGLKLAKLVPGLMLPSGASDAIKITHGLDPQTRRAWLDATIDVAFDEDATIFSFGPVTLRLLKAKFHAVARITISDTGAPEQSGNGFIEGDWEIQLGNKPLVSFLSTRLMFDDSGSLDFDLSPDRVQLSAPLNFLSQLLGSVSGPDGGSHLNLLEENGIPYGFESALSLTMPNLQLGAFGIANLSLRALFRLTARPGKGGFDFNIAIALGLSSRNSPFAITIFLLGGGGWLESSTVYHPFSGEIATTTSIGIMATARLEFSLGPLSGGVGIDVSLSAEFFAATGAGGTLHIQFTITIWGHVEALGFISVSLRLMLQAEYQSGGALVGRGSVEIKIKICFCFTFSFSASVEYTLAGSGASSTSSKRALRERNALLARKMAGGELASQSLTQPGIDSSFARGQSLLLANRRNLARQSSAPNLKKAAQDYIAMFEELHA